MESNLLHSKPTDLNVNHIFKNFFFLLYLSQKGCKSRKPRAGGKRLKGRTGGKAPWGFNLRKPVIGHADLTGSGVAVPNQMAKAPGERLVMPRS